MADKKFFIQEALKDEEDELKKLADFIKGKVVIIYGSPFVGKTVLAHLISKYFNNPIIFRLDENYGDEYKEINPNIKYLDVSDYYRLKALLNNAAEYDNDLIIVDSLTSLASEVLDERNIATRNVLTYMYDKITKQASRLAKKGKTVILIAHERIKDFVSQEKVPRMNLLPLRHVHALIRIEKEGNRRKIIIEHVREKINTNKIEKYTIEGL